MGHDAHFLQRLDRVSDAQVELALTLYRDEALLREVLGRAGLPEGAERLAISLDDPVEGPFIVVTRAGRFVTCLGRGMRIDRDPLPVLPRERLDAAAARVQRMRDGLAEVERLRAEGADGIAARAFRRMQQDGLAFPREEMETLLQIRPLIARQCSLALSAVQHSVRQHRQRAAYLRYQKLKPLERDFAIAFAKCAWSMVHFLVLTDHENSQALLDMAAKSPEATWAVDDLRSLQMQIAFDLGTVPHAYRALWGLAGRPKPALKFLKSLGKDERYHHRVFREFGLGAVALASQKLRSESVKALGRAGDAPPEGAPYEEVLDHAAGTLGDVVRRLVEDPESATPHHLEWGKNFAAMLRTNGDYSAADAASVPDDVARAITGSVPLSWLGDDSPYASTRLAVAVPWLARARPEELYLPAAWVDVAKATDDELYEFMVPYAKESFLERPAPLVLSSPKVGRNSACPCGSGKKHKRCCGGVGARSARPTS